MTDRIETILATQFAADEGDPNNVTERHRNIAKGALAALKAARIAVVELPEPGPNGEWESQPEWWVGTDHDYGAGWVVPHTGRIRLMPDEAREFAAALLAAAAEASQ